MAIPDLLRQLLTAPGPSGREEAPAAIWREAAEAFAEVWSDTMGSSFARVGEGRPRLAVVGHIDEIGILVTHVEDSGLLAFTSIGGYNPEIVVGQRVEIMAKEGLVHGVVGRKRLAPEEYRDRPRLELRDLHIDIGALDADDAHGLVRVGDPGVLSAAPVEFPNGRFTSRSNDNRLGAYVALETARQGVDAGIEVVAVAAVQEEIGLYGARTSVFAIEPDVAIVIDVTPATDVPGGNPRAAGKVELGKGPVIGRGPVINPQVFDLLVESAEEQGIEYAVEVYARSTSTDADEVHLSRSGVPTGLVSVPLRYTHSPIEMAQLSDVEGCARIVAGFARKLGPDTSFVR